MSGNILFLGNKIFEIPPFFQTRPGDQGKKVHACSVHFSALNKDGHLFFLLPRPAPSTKFAVAYIRQTCHPSVDEYQHREAI